LRRTDRVELHLFDNPDDEFLHANHTDARLFYLWVRVHWLGSNEL
jgi:hypothetical protein